MTFLQITKRFDEISKFDDSLGRSGAKEYKSYSSPQELSNEYLVAKFGFDTTDNESSKVTSSYIVR